MKIIVLDGHTLNPDDISWEPLLAVGDVTIFPRTAPDQVVERAADAEVLLVNKIVLGREQITQLPNLRYIGLMATGFDNVDVVTAREQDIAVTNVPAYSTPAVAQHTFALILQLSNRVGIHDKSVHDLEWVRNADFSYFLKPLSELNGKTIGLIGYGKIAREVEKIANAFGMKILIYSRHAKTSAYGRLTDIDTLCGESDIVSLHTSLTDENKNLINADLLARMKPSCWLINTSRGALVNEADLAEALNSGSIGGAGLDVLSREPPLANNPLLTAPNCVITPHISWASRESRIRLLNVVIENIRDFMAGGTRNRVS